MKNLLQKYHFWKDYESHIPLKAGQKIWLKNLTKGGRNNGVSSSAKEDKKEDITTTKDLGKTSELDDNDLEDLLEAKDENSPPVESVFKTRIKDSLDIDMAKVVPQQNYFYSSDLNKLPKGNEKTKRKRKDMESDIKKQN